MTSFVLVPCLPLFLYCWVSFRKVPLHTSMLICHDEFSFLDLQICDVARRQGAVFALQKNGRFLLGSGPLDGHLPHKGRDDEKLQPQILETVSHSNTPQGLVLKSCKDWINDFHGAKYGKMLSKQGPTPEPKCPCKWGCIQPKAPPPPPHHWQVEPNLDGENLVFATRRYHPGHSKNSDTKSQLLATTQSCNAPILTNHLKRHFLQRNLEISESLEFLGEFPAWKPAPEPPPSSTAPENVQIIQFQYISIHVFFFLGKVCALLQQQQQIGIYSTSIAYLDRKRSKNEPENMSQIPLACRHDPPGSLQWLWCWVVRWLLGTIRAWNQPWLLRMLMPFP